MTNVAWQKRGKTIGCETSPNDTTSPDFVLSGDVWIRFVSLGREA